MTHPTWPKLDPYLDGELTAAEMQEVDRHLRECPACAAECLRRVQWKRAVKEAGTRYAASPELKARVHKVISGRASSRRAWRWWPSLAVATALLVLIAAGLFFAQQSARRVRNDQIVAELADLHVATLASNSPVDVVSTDRHTVKPWFEGKIPFSFNLPELQGTPFELIGGRVSYLEQSPGAELIYRVRKHQISAFIFQDRAVPAGFMHETYMDARSFHLET